MRITVTLKLCPTERAVSAIKSGEIQPEEKKLELVWKELSPAIRTRLLEVAGSFEALEQLDLTAVKSGVRSAQFRVQHYPSATSDWDKLLRDYLARCEPQVSAEQRVEDKLNWITAHGSPQLRSMLEQGYTSEQRYASERAAVEHPGFNVCAALITEAVDSPSDDYLASAIRSGGRVVWLPTPPPDAQVLFPAPCHAIIIEPYLGHWRLLRTLPAPPRIPARPDQSRGLEIAND